MSSTDPPVPDPNETAPGGDDPATRTLPLEEALEAGIEPLQGKDEALVWGAVPAEARPLHEVPHGSGATVPAASVRVGDQFGVT